MQCEKKHSDYLGTAKGGIFPPFIFLNNKVFVLSLKEKSEIVMITPAWPTQPYYPIILTLSIDNRILITPMKNLLLSSEGEVHPLVKSQTLKLVACKVSGDEKSSRSFGANIRALGCSLVTRRSDSLQQLLEIVR